MNKKQAVIIVTLLVLIVCAGVLATKVNSPLYVSDTDLVDNNSTISTDSTDQAKANETAANSKSDYFADARLTREKANAKTISTLKSIIDDKNVSEESKKNATQKSINISTASANAAKVENMLKGKGYKEALCTINDDKVNIVVKTDEQKLSDKQLREIRDVVLSVTNLRNIEIEPPVH
ncbi:stage III sporulation protein AH [Clostridium pasteurianum DSM 525 = ATCC 6013]|uniref:Stage III sporulation protein AH n=1 Tax=Clostridium pasteurianum DSM 525 = ATCC 6013 TaxID=1262449 RepID=A0A0H3J3D0_CLOPA|nr:SpoIIIAH-like family protein [Clostridium pasteurianum]AJA47974.1 stage III sporulation protein AH [Clostridium pasteurianum DSM 525 = ATCC 6013]AJA51962.1 stage III sporulation protein AH [Clostridium pasteurianum DSM 525 = ATCC 6013]AOZ75259.1 stage III sporulation protein AH [Clostridium pasteurianum DSM 525 = ATCC 6013]AOZ79054.1 stage III sporulation protein AH [Clostridium pasteurianum]ELP59877.1 Stage III sporulation protein AH, SpoIIIAH [Clostridium pasteurianum DSM 525 = ATCC 6013]